MWIQARCFHGRSTNSIFIVFSFSVQKDTWIFITVRVIFAQKNNDIILFLFKCKCKCYMRTLRNVMTKNCSLMTWLLKYERHDYSVICHNDNELKLRVDLWFLTNDSSKPYNYESIMSSTRWRSRESRLDVSQSVVTDTDFQSFTMQLRQLEVSESPKWL